LKPPQSKRILRKKWNFEDLTKNYMANISTATRERGWNQSGREKQPPENVRFRESQRHVGLARTEKHVTKSNVHRHSGRATAAPSQRESERWLALGVNHVRFHPNEPLA
jgi:hypothetical protein